MTDWSVVKAT